jgi:hypothetical protein
MALQSRKDEHGRWYAAVVSGAWCIERDNGESLGLYELSRTIMDCKRCMDPDYVTSDTKPGTKQAKIYTHDLLGLKTEVSDFEQNKDGDRHCFLRIQAQITSAFAKNSHI